MADTFTLYPLLPYDVRCLIWEATFPSRILTFTCSTPEYRRPSAYDGSLYAAPTNAVGSHGCNTTWTLVESIYDHYPKPKLLRGIQALQVCQESRRYTLKAGYRILPICFVGDRDMGFDYNPPIVYWSPNHDVLYIAEQHKTSTPLPLFWLLDPGPQNMVFFELARVANWLAVGSSLWNGDGSSNQDENEKFAEIWRKYGKLKEVTIVFNEGYELERGRRDRNENGRLEMADEEFETAKLSRETVFPDDVIKGIELGKAARPELVDWKPPKFRLVKNQYRILTQDSLQMSMRCALSPFVEAEWQEWEEEERRDEEDNRLGRDGDYVNNDAFREPHYIASLIRYVEGHRR